MALFRFTTVFTIARIILTVLEAKTRNKPLLVVSILILGLGVSSAGNAILIDRGNGMIYDTDQDITWLQDANYAMTSGYDNDGSMTWDQSVAWADSLSYGGYNDWRLPTVMDSGNDGCTSNSECGYIGGFDTSGSELAYMWYDNLGNTAGAGWDQVSTTADGVDILNL